MIFLLNTFQSFTKIIIAMLPIILINSTLKENKVKTEQRIDIMLMCFLFYVIVRILY